MANVSSFSGAMPVIPGGLVELGTTSYSAGNVAVTATTTGTANEVIAPMTVVCDGGPVLVEFIAPSAYPPLVSGGQLMIGLYIDGAKVSEYWGFLQTAGTTSAARTPVHLTYRTSPSAGSHTFGVKAYVSNSAGGSIENGSSSTGFSPLLLRVSKIVNQNDGLKPFWTPPVVTQLPSQATVGDQVIYAADATKGIYWTLYYDGIGTYPWKFIGGSAYHDIDGNAVVTGTGATTNTTPTWTVPLAGDYFVNISHRKWNSNGAGESHLYLRRTDTNAYFGPYVYGRDSGIDEQHTLSERAPVNIPTAAFGIGLAHYSSVAQGRSDQRRIEVTPIRVKAA